MVVLHHEIVAQSAPTAAAATDAHAAAEEVHTSSLVVYGTDAGSAMSRCVGLPVAFAALRVLDGHVKVRGVVGPTGDQSVYVGVLRDLEEVGLGMKESVGHGQGMEEILAMGLISESALRPRHCHEA